MEKSASGNQKIVKLDSKTQVVKGASRPISAGDKETLALNLSRFNDLFMIKSAFASRAPIEEDKSGPKRERMEERNKLPRCVSESSESLEFSGPRGEGCNIVSRDN